MDYDAMVASQKAVIAGAFGGQVVPKSVTPQMKLAEAVDHLRKAAGLVSGLAAQISGSQPPSPGTEAARGYGDGLLSDIERHADQINEIAAGIISEAQRVSQRL